MIKTAQETKERYYNANTKEQPNFVPGNMVMLRRTNIQATRPSDKLNVKNLGPFKVLERVNSRSFRLELPKTRSRLRPVFHVSLLERYRPNMIEGRKRLPPPHIEIDGEEEYVVEKIEYSRIRNKKLEYLVKFEGYGDPQWQPAENLEHAPEIVAPYHTKYPQRPGPLPSNLEGSP